MSSVSSAPAPAPIALPLEIAVAAIDDMSSIRHLHASSARRLAAGLLSEAEIEAFAQHVYSPAYSTRVADVVVAERMLTAKLDGELIATGGWLPANDTGSVARLIGVFVAPLYARLGVGRRVLAAIENEARHAGFTTFTVRAPLSSAPFFSGIGYDIASHGVWPLGRDVALPVAFMRKVAPRPQLHAVTDNEA